MTPLAPVVAFPLRVRQVARHNARELRSFVELVGEFP